EPRAKGSGRRRVPSPYPVQDRSDRSRRTGLPDTTQNHVRKAWRRIQRRGGQLPDGQALQSHRPPAEMLSAARPHSASAQLLPLHESPGEDDTGNARLRGRKLLRCNVGRRAGSAHQTTNTLRTTTDLTTAWHEGP